MVRPHKEGGKASDKGAAIGPVRRFGRYTLVKKLATGGMAEIWLARQRGLAGFNRFVVIKKILGHLSEQETFVRMFLDEARTSAHLNHPNIVQIYDLGQEGDSYFIAMEFIAGENLAAIAWRGMKRGRPFSAPFAARTIADACKALHYAHHMKAPDGRPLEIVHRDISPQNILVTYEGEVKIVDFGIAKAASKSEHTKTGMLKGKFSYMSPEQCLGAPVDMRSDVFALGILLYELCTGKRLFKHESELMILDMITKRTVIPPSQVTPGIPSPLEAIIMRALEKDPAARFQTAQEMQIALEEFLKREPRSTSADIAAYMRDLFGDKIEEKARLRELASRDDFEQAFASEAATERAVGEGRDPEDPVRRRVVHGLPPSQLSQQRLLAGPTVTGLPAAAVQGLASAPPLTPGAEAMAMGGLTPVAHPASYSGPTPAYPSNVYPPGALPERTSPATVAVIVGALAVILVACIILVQQLWPAETVVSTDQLAPVPQVASKTGTLNVDSVPSGAVIHIDGQPMRMQGGLEARTPSDLSMLQYGRPYRLKLVKEGHKPFEETIVMDQGTDGRHIQPKLEAFPGTLVVEVTGPKNREVRVLVNGGDVGVGPQLQLAQPGNSTVVVQGEADGVVCTAEPARLRIEPNASARVTLTCAKPKSMPPRDGPSRTPSSASPPKRRTVERPKDTSAPGACATRDDVPKGFLTIDSTPYSELFWKGRRIGSTPLANYPMPAGCVTIEAVNTEQGKRKTVNLDVEPNRVRTYRITLVPAGP